MVDATASQTSILNLVNKTLDLPTIPEVLTKLNEVIENEHSVADDVAEVISKDPAVSANLLRIVNSAYYGLQVRVSSINLAVSVLGFSMTKRVALKAAVFSRFANKNSKLSADLFDPVAFWRHSIFTGIATRSLGVESDALKATNTEDLYICGLLHDIGKIILAENVPDEFGEVLRESAKSGRPTHEIEREHFGFTHADVGSVLAIKWFLPEDLTIAIRYHHEPTQDPFGRPLSSLMHIADHLAWSAGHPSTKVASGAQLVHEAYDAAGLDADRVEGLREKIQEDFAATGLPF